MPPFDSQRTGRRNDTLPGSRTPGYDFKVRKKDAISLQPSCEDPMWLIAFHKQTIEKHFSHLDSSEISISASALKGEAI